MVVVPAAAEPVVVAVAVVEAQCNGNTFSKS
jgi:hypothetical protein